MKILYIGSSGALSLVPFKRLLSSKYDVAAAGVYNPVVMNTKIIALENESLALAARQKNIPLIDLSAATDSILAQITDLSIDLILIACYSKKLPARIIKRLDNACFNLHPSLLPAYRGPEPVFWQMKQASTMGVSWHWLNEDFDAGDIALQTSLQLEDGLSYEAINRQLAETGATLMMKLLADYAAATLSANAQDNQQASYYPYPQQQDFVVDRQWTARHAYNFMCATYKFGQVYRCQYKSYSYLLGRALAYEIEADGDGKEISVNNDNVLIPCKQGVLIATYAGKILPL